MLLKIIERSNCNLIFSLARKLFTRLKIEMERNGGAGPSRADVRQYGQRNGQPAKVRRSSRPYKSIEELMSLFHRNNMKMKIKLERPPK